MASTGRDMAASHRQPPAEDCARAKQILSPALLWVASRAFPPSAGRPAPIDPATYFEQQNRPMIGKSSAGYLSACIDFPASVSTLAPAQQKFFKKYPRKIVAGLSALNLPYKIAGAALPFRQFRFQLSGGAYDKRYISASLMQRAIQ